jgi:hypothetical protein
LKTLINVTRFRTSPDSATNEIDGLSILENQFNIYGNAGNKMKKISLEWVALTLSTMMIKDTGKNFKRPSLDVGLALRRLTCQVCYLCHLKLPTLAAIVTKSRSPATL